MSNTAAKQPPVTGRKILFVGGPEAGNVRLVPEGNDRLRSDDGYMYAVHGIAMPGDQRVIFIAFEEGRSPIEAIVDIWREYSETAQIKRGIGLTDGRTYQSVKQNVAAQKKDLEK
jgi:hypothetical protein